jgi:acetyl esterase/lipase
MMEARVDVRVVADQVYSRVGGVERLADLYIPAARSPLPVVIWLHGGGWRFGDRHLAPDLAQFAERAGLAVVSIEYRLSDEAKFPAPIEDVKTAVRWVRSVASYFRVDGGHIGLWGSSAGGHIAACAALSLEDAFRSDEHPDYSTAVQAVVDGYGPTNFAHIDKDRASHTSVGTDAESVAIGSVLPAGDPDSFESRFLGAPVSSSPREVELADPVHYIRKGGCPPFLILHGEADSLIPSSLSRYLFDALTTAGSDATLVLFEKLKHGFFNDRNLEERDYGKVTIHPSPNTANQVRWACNPTQNIPSMVSSFFQAHLSTT